MQTYLFINVNVSSENILPHYLKLKQERTRRRRRSRKKDKKDMVGRDNEQTQNLGVTQSFKSSPVFSPLTTQLLKSNKENSFWSDFSKPLGN